jgi:glutamyl/glutaminyl-tRNA synthetase
LHFQIEPPHVVSYQEGVVTTQPAIRNPSAYRGRIAPSPTGHLHLGHARTFWTAQQRARDHGGTVILRNDDLDQDRCRPEFVRAMYDDLRWFGFEWQEGPDVGGPFAPYNQSERMPLYRDTLNRLIKCGALYPCTCSRKDIQAAITAPHAADDEAIYPGTCRPKQSYRLQVEGCMSKEPATFNLQPATKFSWRFRVPDGEIISFTDANLGPQQFVAGRDFGDFVIWRHDDVPAYQLACVADDAAMQITEVVRGADLLVSTARQLLLYRELNLPSPAFFHCPLMNDENGIRLAKRHETLSLRHLREQGRSPEEIRASLV